MYIYYPSCNFQRLFPDTAKKIRAYMEGQEDAAVAGCCHVTNDVPKEGDVIVTVCMSCMRVLDEVRSDTPQVSLFEFLLTRRGFAWPDLGGEEITVQDCFRARGKHGLQDALRECLRRMNAVPVEMEHNRDEEGFDGSFLLHAPYPQNVREAPRYFGEYLPRFTADVPASRHAQLFAQHAKLYRTKRVACCCNTCTTAAREGGADAHHLAELIFA